MITTMRGCVAHSDLWPWPISLRSFGRDLENLVRSIASTVPDGLFLYFYISFYNHYIPNHFYLLVYIISLLGFLCVVHLVQYIILIPPARVFSPNNEVFGGYIGFSPSVCPSVCPSVRPSVRLSRLLCLLCNIYSSGWILTILATNDHYYEGGVAHSDLCLTLTYIFKVIRSAL